MIKIFGPGMEMEDILFSVSCMGYAGMIVSACEEDEIGQLHVEFTSKRTSGED